MENIITHPHSPERTRHMGRTLGLGLLLGAALLANLGDRAFSASAANGGIDPLQILDTAVTNNILFIVDTSGSMAGTPEDQNRIVGGDDPASRFYQTKRAVREVITQNAGKANFGLATFHPDFTEHRIDGAQALVYVTQDPSASVWRGYFQAPSTTFANFDDDTCNLGTPAGTCSTAERQDIFRGLSSETSASSTAYPAVCTPQPGGRQVSNTGVTNPPITHVYGTHCRDYIKSKLMRNGKRYVVTPGVSTTSSLRLNTAVVSSSNITCPPPPPGLVGDDVLAAADGSQARACFQIQNASTSEITTYWVTGTNFDFINDPPPAPSPVPTPNVSCDQSGLNVDVADCGVDNSEQINSYMRQELQYNAALGAPRDVPAMTDLANRKPNISEAPPFSLDVTPPIVPTGLNPGIRQGNGTPLAASMTFALNYFRTTVLPAAGTLKRPVVAQGRQKQFVILLSDGDESCSSQAAANTAAYNLWANTLPALPACTGACLTAKGITAAQWSVANRIELLMITFAGGTPANVDAISRAGTGRNPGGSPTNVCQPLYPGFGATPLSPCRTAFIANNLTELVNALNAAINTSTATGEFSDQQSVTETVFEFGLDGVPSVEPLDPEDRYGNSVPILLQSTFELPGWKGRLNAFRRSAGNTSLQVWDAGQTLYDRVANVPQGMGTTEYTFAELYGNAAGATEPFVTSVVTSNAKIKRRIFTTTQNGVNAQYTPSNLVSNNPSGNANATAGTGPRRISLWPPTVGGLGTVAPLTPATAGLLDAAMGFGAWTTVAQVQAAVLGVCQGTVAGDIHADCTSGTAGVPLARAKFEARQITLANLAGAQMVASNGVPIRFTATDPTTAKRRELRFVARPWILSESTLAAPGVVTPPLLAGPKAGVGAVGVPEYAFYRDGVKVSEVPVSVSPGQVVRGMGLRNPDRLLSTMPQTAKDAAAADPDLKPVMSVVYHATNFGLHAFRAGPCPTPPAGGGGLFASGFDCSTSVERSLDADPLLKRELGGEELWSFVPFDLLGKLPALTKLQGRGDKQYLLASPVRFSDIFVPGGASVGGQSVGNGVWRTIMYFGRGQGGKYYTAIDVTGVGPFTKHSLNTEPPIVVWSRGNPDTSLGAAGGSNNGSGTDASAYLKMGETWSLPAVGFVTAASYSGAAFVLFTGSGYSDNPHPEGRTFFVLNALNGNVIREHVIAPGSAPPPVHAPATSPYTNFLVAPPVVYAEDADGNSPSGYRFIGNPIGAKAKVVYFGDLHGRIWRYNVDTPATPPAAFFTASGMGNQPFATAVSVLQNRPDTAVPGEVLVFAESGHDRRVPVPAEGNRPPVPGAQPFRAFAFKDLMTGAPGVLQFSRNFEVNYRGSVQPASAFAQPTPPAAPTEPPVPVVFYAGSKFTSVSCIGVFDSILIALKAPAFGAAPAAPVEAFDLRATGDDSFLEFTGKKINAIRVSGEGSLVIDQGLNAENPPPPPGVAVPSETVSTSSSLVTIGLQPGTQAFRDLSATTVPFRVGSSVCRTEY